MLDRRTRRFFDEHVQADAVHEQIAAHDLCGGLLTRHPALGGEVLFGAIAYLTLERLFAEHLLASWRSRTTSFVLGVAPVVAVL
jgi:Iron-containing redox enzyme